MKSLEEILKERREEIGRVVPIDLNKERMFVFDFTRNNRQLQRINFLSPQESSKYIKDCLIKNSAKVGIGKYNENRIVYKHKLFRTKDGEFRSIHLGVDIFLPAGTKIFAPLDATLHSFQNNSAPGDYGPTIILQHEIDGLIFYTLYGHLSRESLVRKMEGMRVKKGEIIGKIGNVDENGGWPEHLHFQIIKDMEGRKGDFPGVASVREKEKYLKLCPDPNIILNISSLRVE